jgi:hypothetical protein
MILYLSAPLIANTKGAFTSLTSRNLFDLKIIEFASAYPIVYRSDQCCRIRETFPSNQYLGDNNASAIIQSRYSI